MCAYCMCVPIMYVHDAGSITFCVYARTAYCIVAAEGPSDGIRKEIGRCEGKRRGKKRRKNYYRKRVYARIMKSGKSPNDTIAADEWTGRYVNPCSRERAVTLSCADGD